jgi:hypothetical protein
MKNLKSKISIIFMLLFIILSTAYISNAASDALFGKLSDVLFGEVIIDSEHTHTYSNGSYIPYSNLNDYYDVFCCQKGTTLNGENRTEVAQYDGKNMIDGTGLGVSYPYLTRNDLGMTILTRRSSFAYSSYNNYTIGRYKIKSTNIATPKEAYVLSEMKLVDGDGEYNYAQYAWWTTKAGSEGNTVSKNDFALEAEGFEAYILEVSDVTSTDALKYKTATFTTKDGVSKTYENAFDFDYEPEWIVTDEYATPTVTWDGDAYKIGPFALDYIGTTEKYGDREEVQFAGITNMEIYTDASSDPLVLGTDWEFVWLDGERSSAEDSEFPLAKEKFYIKLNYIENATKITNIKTEFRYMNASGVYQKLQGTYFKATWKEKSQDYYDEEGEYDYTEYWLKLTGLKEFESQRLALGLNAARWYEYVELDRKIDLTNGKIRIYKELVDEDGNTVTPEDKEYFYFKVTVNGAINSGSEVIKVRAGEYAESSVYYWNEEDGAPSYTVEEISKDGYKLYSIENSSGSLKEFGTVVVKAKNVHENEGDIKITKEIVKKTLNGSEGIVDGTFNFKVTLSGSFKYDGQQYNNTSLTIDAKITTSGGTGSWTSNKVKWYGDTAPKYTVEEVKTEGFELVTIERDSGRLSNNVTVPVKAKNTQEIEKAKIHIIKTLENAELYDEEEIMNLKFNFVIKVDGYNDERIEVSALRKDNTYIWEYTTGYYEWLYGNNPNYTITEVNNPDGTEFVGANSPDVTVSVSGQTVSGKLVSDESKNYEVTNNIINRSTDLHNAKIHITKNVDTDRLKDKDYTFAVTVKGSFVYQGVSYRNTTIQITNDKSAIEIANENYDNTKLVTIHVDSSKVGEWLSDEITWYGKTAPEYKVEENTAGLDVNSSIIPTSGYLSDKVTDNIEVVAWNRDNTPKAGYIHIIKTLDNADKCSTDYINSLVFKFKIHVDGYEDIIVSLQPEKQGNSYVWEYTSEDPYTWPADEAAPNYTIEEVDVPEGTAFVTANGGTDIKVSGQLKEAVATDNVLTTTDNTYVNTAEEKTGNLIIDKKVTSETLNGVEFKFNVTIKGTFEYNGSPCTEQEVTEQVTVSGGSTWTSGTIKWYGGDAPTYTVEELESDKADNISVINAAGTIKEGASATVATFINEPKLTSGYLQITKSIASASSNGSAYLDKEFTFNVTIGSDTFVVKLKPGQTYKSDKYTWFVTEEAPSYSIEEVSDSAVEKCEIDKQSGKLQANGETVQVSAVNYIKEHEGNFSVKKVIVADEKLLDGLAMPSFTITMKISGTFQMDGETITDGTKTITTTLQKDGVYTSPTIKWWGDEAPVVDVVEENIPTGWKNIGISNNGAELSEGTTEIVVTNRLDTLTIIDLTMSLAGDVWEDEPLNKDDKNTENSVANGIMDSTEKGVQGVEVYIYDNNGSLATILDENGEELTQPIITAESGHWYVPGVRVLKGGTYDVEFVYDGQTYEPTTALVTGDAGSFKSASTSGRDAWAKDSMALDTNRDEVNNRIQSVNGNLAIDGNGDTVGTASGASGDYDLFYEGTYNTGTNRIDSKLQTTNNNGLVYDVFKTKARTSAAGLTFPFDSKIHLESYDTYINELGLVQYYKYSATYNYLLHINLGLVTREKADVEAVKDLYSAKVVVNDRLLNYRFNSLADFGKDVLTRRSEIDSYNTKYELGLYATDYYYRADLYRTSSNISAYDSVESFYKSYYDNLEGTELEVYLKYKISLYNQSSTYSVVINSVDDYFDSSFGSPIQTDITKYVKTVDGKEVDSVETVAEKSTVSWTVTDKDIKGSDGTTYNKMTASNLGIKLASGESAEIYVTFAIQKDTLEGVQDAIELGEKSNVTEIASYSTYNKDGSVAGKVDKDSAPANVNITDHNDKAFYDDDTDKAPVLDLTLENSERTIDGIAWEDNSESGTVGVRDNDEALIGGLTTELVEKVKVKTGDEYTEYDFLWPTNETLNCLGGKTMEHLTGFDSTIETARESKTDEDGNVTIGVGGYKFTGVPTGNYVVRFIYGNDKTKLSDTYGITGDAVALKEDGTSYSGNANILTANYDGDKEQMTPAVYNGQDYKSTIYELGFTSVDENGYVNNEWHDLANSQLAEAKVSDARDSEARRLEVMAKSETITNINGKVLTSANVVDEKHTDLYNDYYMFADSAKLNIEMLNLKDQNGVQSRDIQGTIYRNRVIAIKEETTEYAITGIDFGLVERPENNIVLDKEISEIKLTTNDQKVIFDAAYDISYELVDAGLFDSAVKDKVIIAKMNNKYLVAKVELNSSSISTDLMQAIDKQENKLTYADEVNDGIKNFRYINVDDSILQGLTIELNYMITALNVGETDYTSSTLENMYDTAKANSTLVKDEILSIANNVAEQTAKSSTTDSVVKLGEYLGTNYYTGNVGRDVVVTTRIRQLVDYVDNDAIFASADNTTKDHSWKNTTVTELTGNGYESDRLIDETVTQQYELIDQNDIAYITDQRNNVILSIDNPENAESLTNSGFEAKLVPYEVDSEAYKSSIELKVTKTVGVNTDDAANLTFDNVTEVVKYENSVGRRDETTTPGNVNPRLGEFEEAINERDSSATELVTFTPPTGLEVQNGMQIQILIVVIAALAIAVVGIVIIKKKVL